MAEEKAPVAAAPASTPDFQAAALKALQEGPPKAAEKAPEAPAAAPAEPVQAEKAPPDDKAAVADAEKKLSEEMAAKKAEEAKPPKGWERPFETLAREKAAVREQAQALKAQEALIEEGRRAKEAREKGDPLELLKANGWEWDDVVAHLTGQKRDPNKAPAPKVNDEIAQLRAEVMAMKAEKQQAALMDTIGKAIETSEFRFVKELATPQQVYAELDAYHRQNGELPVPGDFQASVALVLEAAETNLKGTAERFKKVIGLTSAPTSASVGGAAAKGDVNRSSELSSNTLSNSLDGAPRATTQAAKPQTPEEYRAAALQALVNGPKR